MGHLRTRQKKDAARTVIHRTKEVVKHRLSKEHFRRGMRIAKLEPVTEEFVVGQHKQLRAKHD